MKKIYSFFFVSLLALSANAQLTTNSNYDVNADGKVTVDDAAAVVSNYVGDKSGERQMVGAEQLNATLQSIYTEMKSMCNRLSAIESKLGISQNESDDTNNGHDYVDLGTGVKWATMNIGASSPEDYGHYFAWGATEPQSVYDWVNCPYQTQNTNSSFDVKFSKYLDSTSSLYKDDSATDANAKKAVLDPEDDAAHVVWGGKWRMPTKEEQDALLTECYWQWVTSYNGKNVNGYIVYKVKAEADKGKYSFNNPSLVADYSVSDAHIFLPAAGFYDFSELFDTGSRCNYWSSSLYTDQRYDGCDLGFTSGNVYSSYSYRNKGQSVRAVCQ